MIAVIRAARRRATVRQISIGSWAFTPVGGGCDRGTTSNWPSVHVTTSVTVSRIFVERISISSTSLINPDINSTLPSGTPVSARASSASASARSATMPLRTRITPSCSSRRFELAHTIAPDSTTRLRCVSRRSNVIGVVSLRRPTHSSTSSAGIVPSAPRTDIP
jgi:hypothetical protein